MANDFTLAIDPGPEKSGWVSWWDGKIDSFGHKPNEEMLDHGALRLVIEDVSHYGPDVTVGKDIFETCKWMGRFDQMNRNMGGSPAIYISRPDIKLHLLGVRRGTDSQIRQALIDKYGGNLKALGAIKCKTCKGKGWNGRGRPSCPDCHCDIGRVTNVNGQPDIGCGWEVHPGPLAGITSHMWSALAVLQTYLDQQEKEVPI